MKKRFEYGCDICDDRIIVLESKEDVGFTQMASHALNLGWQYAQTDEGEILICPDCSEESTILPINPVNRNPADNIKKVSARMGLASVVSLLFVVSLSLIILWTYDKKQEDEVNLVTLASSKNIGVITQVNTEKADVPNEMVDAFHLEADETADVDPNIISKIEADPEKYADKIEAVELSDESEVYDDIDRELTISNLKLDLEKALTPPDDKTKVKVKKGYSLVEKNIKDNLNNTALDANLSPKQALALSNIFKDQINFQKDLTTKDTLSILFDNNSSNSIDKNIKLIQLTAKGKTYQAIQNEADKDNFKLLEKEKEFTDLLDLISQNKTIKITVNPPLTKQVKPEDIPKKNIEKKQLTEKKATPPPVKKKTPGPSTHGKYAYYTGDINRTLSSSAADIGLGFTHVKRLMHIFSYSVNSKRLAKGDQFSVIFDKKELKEKGIKAKILAAEFVVKGKRHQRVRYTDKKGKSAYYMLNSKGPTTTTYKTTVKGGSKNGFLRYPLKFSRVSSGFNLRRRHPISRRIRPHKGTDFAAPRGTPVKASGNGVISYSGWQRGYGRVVKIKHNNGKYETIYAHLSRINKRSKKGRSVGRGKIIGYVGSTGNSTGNHLHYEFRVRNRAVNPLRVKLPKAGKVVVTKTKNASESKKFKLLANRMKAELKYCSKKNQVLASAKGK